VYGKTSSYIKTNIEKENINRFISNNEIISNENKQTKNVILKKESNNEYILLNLEGNEIKCTSNNKNSAYNNIIKNDINDSNKINNNTINITSLSKDKKYSNKYLKPKIPELIEKGKNLNSEDIHINITTVQIDEYNREYENNYQYKNVYSSNENMYINNIDKIKKNSSLFVVVDPPNNNKIIENNFLEINTNKNLNKICNSSKENDDNSESSSLNDGNIELYNKQDTNNSNINNYNKQSKIIKDKIESDSLLNENRTELHISISPSESEQSLSDDLKSISSNNETIQSSNILNSNTDNNLSSNESELKISNIEIHDKTENSYHTSLCDKESELSSLEWNISDISDESSNNTSQVQNIASINTPDEKIIDINDMDNNKNIEDDENQKLFAESVAEKALNSYKV